MTDPDPSRPDIEVASWADLDGLPGEMDLLAAQLTAIARYARRWACQREGFEPSPLCLLRPLAELMDHLADAFGALERVALEDWAELRAGVVAATTDLRDADARVAGRLAAVA